MFIVEKIKEFFNKIFKNKSTGLTVSIELANTESAIIHEDVQHLHDSINIGDIILAKRYRNEEEKEIIPEHHRISPYVVIDKCDKGLVCYYCGSAVSKKIDISKFYKLDSNDYNLNKDTYVRLDKKQIIDKYRFIEKIDVINLVDYNNLFRLKDSREKKVDFKPGDLVECDKKLYFICSECPEGFYLVDVTSDVGDCSFIYAGKAFKLNFDSGKLMDLNDNNSNLKGILNSKSLEIVLNSFKAYTQRLDSIDNIRRGSLIVFKDNYYYVYGEDGNNYLTMRVFKEVNDNKVIIFGEEYYTSFEELTISKDEDITSMLIAKEKEIDIIKELRKGYKLKEKLKVKEAQKAKKSKNMNLLSGSIVRNKRTFAHEEYIVIYDSGNELYVVDKDDYFNYGKIHFDLLYRCNTYVVGSIDDTKLLELLVACKKSPMISSYINNKNMCNIIDKVKARM